MELRRWTLVWLTNHQTMLNYRTSCIICCKIAINKSCLLAYQKRLSLSKYWRCTDWNRIRPTLYLYLNLLVKKRSSSCISKYIKRICLLRTSSQNVINLLFWCSLNELKLTWICSVEYACCNLMRLYWTSRITHSKIIESQRL